MALVLAPAAAARAGADRRDRGLAGARHAHRGDRRLVERGAGRRRCAAGKLADLRDWMLRTRAGDAAPARPGLGRPALFTGNRLVRALREVVGEPRIEDLPIEFTAVAVDLCASARSGCAAATCGTRCARRSRSPACSPRSNCMAAALVDGGLLAPLPITATRLSDAHRLIAVDMHGWPGAAGRPGARRGPMAGARRRACSALDRPPLRRRRRWRRTPRPSLRPDRDHVARVDTMQAQIARVQLALDPPELVIRIPRAMPASSTNSGARPAGRHRPARGRQGAGCRRLLSVAAGEGPTPAGDPEPPAMTRQTHADRCCRQP